MSIYMSRAELEEISEGLITAYANKFSNRVIQSIDIERSRDVADLQWHTKRHIIS